MSELRQITDTDGNVLIEPYLTMANDNFDAEYIHAANEEYRDKLTCCFKWDESSQGWDFWNSVFYGNHPETTQPTTQPTTKAAKAARKQAEIKCNQIIDELESDYGVKVSAITTARKDGTCAVEIRACV